MSSSDHHWVEDLFPPTFAITLDDIISKDKQGEEGNDGQAVESQLDISGIKNVYKRVWLMEELCAKEEQERDEKEKEEKELAEAVAEYEAQRQRRQDHKKHREGRPQTKTASTSTADLTTDVSKSCVWNTEEIGMLRRVFQEAKRQNAELRTMLRITAEDHESLKSKHAKQKKILDEKTNSLQEALKANKRLQLLSTNLKTQVGKLQSTVNAQEEDIDLLNAAKTGYQKDMHKMQLEVDRERIGRKNAEALLERRSQEAMQDLNLQREHLETLHAQDIASLNKQISELKAELEQERHDHKRTHKGLEHLRHHFSSLPLSGETQAQRSSVVKEDQLKKWTY